MSSVKRAKHAVYDTKYHLVWIPKYRKNMLDRKIKECIKEVFQEITEQFKLEIDTMEVMKDHVHFFLLHPDIPQPELFRSWRAYQPSRSLEDFPISKVFSGTGSFGVTGTFVISPFEYCFRACSFRSNSILKTQHLLKNKQFSHR